MSTIVSYKGDTIATVNNNIKTLLTQGKYLEANIILTETNAWFVSNTDIGHIQTGAEAWNPSGLETYPGGLPKAFIIYRTTPVTTLSDNICLALIYDSSKAIAWRYTNNTVCRVENVHVAITSYNPMFYIAFYVEDMDNLVFDSVLNYKMIAIYGHDDNLVFKTATYNPPSGTTSGQFTIPEVENPPIYVCGLDTTVTLASYHRVETVVKVDYNDIDILNGTNFYTNNLGYYTDFTESYNNGTLTITSSGTNQGGYFHNQSNPTSQYTLYYLTSDDLAGPNYVVPTGTLQISGNGTYDVSSYASAEVTVASTINNQSKTVTPTESQQTISADSGYSGLSTVTVNAISNTYVGSGITRRSSSDLSASGATVTVPAGYYASQATKSVSTTTHPNPTASINSSTGLVTASHTQTAGYVSAGTTTGTLQLTTQAAKTVTPTSSSQTAVAAGRYTTGVVTVAAIPSNYVDSSTLKTYYTGSSAPSSSLGANGDLYFQSTGA